jgi:hypothetical protein
MLRTSPICLTSIPKSADDSPSSAWKIGYSACCHLNLCLSMKQARIDILAGHQTRRSITNCWINVPKRLPLRPLAKARAMVAKTVALRDLQGSLNEVSNALKSPWMRADPSLLFNKPIGTGPIVSTNAKISDHQ